MKIGIAIGYFALATVAVIYGLPALEISLRGCGWWLVILIYGVELFLVGLTFVVCLHLRHITSAEYETRLVFACTVFLFLAQLTNLIGSTLNLSNRIEIVENIRLGDFATATEVQGGFLEIDGFIGPPTLRSIADYSNRINLEGILISSSGGLIDDARAIGEILQKSATDVYVLENCESACVIIATSGDRLFAKRDTQFGFHNGGILLHDTSTQLGQYGSKIATKGLYETLHKNGVPADILTLVNDTPNQSMSYVSGIELYEKGVVTNLID